MFTSWLKRKARLGVLLQSNGDEDEDGLALDRILHGQSVIAKTAKTIEVDKLRFTDKDLTVIGTLEYGQFSTIDVVNCNIDGRVYVRKSIEKRFALKTREQCNPQLEREILLRALRTSSVWAPHLMCAFQTGTHLNLVMDYAEGGTLWDVLESNPLERICEDDLHWWLPQVISSVAWCHSQGFVHRDVKPHNFVITRTAHIQLIDFGSSAPLVPGSRVVPPEYCRVPCGTCDYISPEILQAHEAALVAMELSDEEEDRREENAGEGGYGAETDWWSAGAMIYEMVFGVAPFFARDIRSTYLKIVDFRRSLAFPTNMSLSIELCDLLTHLLTDAETRLGRHGTKEIMQHPFFDGTMWENLHSERHPSDLHLPLFTYNEDLSGAPAPRLPDPVQEPSSIASTPFAFSAFFQPSEEGSHGSPGLSALRTASSILREEAGSFFIGFSWGPTDNAFPDAPLTIPPTPSPAALRTHHIPVPQAQPEIARSELKTPMRRIGTGTATGTGSLPRPSTLRRTAPRRAVSDREAMRQLVDCIGLSARKKVLEAGRTPRGALASAGARAKAKTLRFAMHAPLNFANGTPGPDGDSATLSSALALALATSDDEESDGASASTGDAPPSPSPSPGPRPGSAMSMLSRRSVTPTATLLLQPRAAPPWGAQAQTRPSSSSSSSSSSSPPPEGDEDALEVLEERYRALMGDIASIEGKVGAMRRRTR
ncbi:kinase-like protein [Lactarius psammicola]|nr:kinase-like protein [Lactarius psammicola]